MKVVQLDITNFRCVSSASVQFDGHTLLLGMNNVGKSTIFEALELVLGQDRLARYPVVEEFDFFNASYLKWDNGKPISIPLEVQVTLVDLSEEVSNKCSGHFRYWKRPERRLLAEGELEQVDESDVCECLRLKTIAQYDIELDDFVAKTYFVDGPRNADNELTTVDRRIKQLFGFLYLRALRTGTRALSLERGSLLDHILRRQKLSAGIWEDSIRTLRELNPAIGEREGASNLIPILENIEKRLAQYIPLSATGRATKLFVSQLTRDHLRDTISFFLATSKGQQPVPFQDVGTGTLNVLVLALLTFIAEIKKDNVIFAMEEPEIALPPHTQRRIANYLRDNATQCLVTSHSPYVIERFDTSQIRVLRRDDSGNLSATEVPHAVMKPKNFNRHARRALAEAMLSRAVVVTEGVSDCDALQAVAAVLEDDQTTNCYAFDLSGVTIFSLGGDGLLAEFGAFFKAMDVESYAFYDSKKKRSQAELDKLNASFHLAQDHGFKGLEELLVTETSDRVMWDFLVDLRNSGDMARLSLPNSRPARAALEEITKGVLENDKGSGYARRLIEFCSTDELPKSIVTFLKKVYERFPKPNDVPPPETAKPTRDGHGSETEKDRVA